MVFENLAAMAPYVGKEIGVSDWVEITQEQVNMFAEATGDHQWIHIDPERATKESPFKAPIAHGFLTLSLASMLISQVIEVKSAKMGVNYGLNKVRFTSHVPVGAKVRMRCTLNAQEDFPPNGKRSVYGIVFEIEGQEKPACVAEWIGLSFE